MRKLWLPLAVFFMTGFSVSAQWLDIYGHLFAAGVSAGTLFGTGDELFYRYADSDDKASRLLWHFEPLVYAGVDLHYNWRLSAGWLSLFADGMLKLGIPGKTGTIEDFDWADMYNADWLTMYSVSENHTNEALLIDATAGVSIAVLERCLLKIGASYSFMRYLWAAKGGSYLYPDDDSVDASDGHGYVSASNTIGTYEQTWHIISPGISFYGAFNDYFDMEVFLKISPFVWLSTRDDHLLRNMYTTKETNNGLFIEPGLVFSFKPNGSVVVSVAFAYRNISGARGDEIIHVQGAAPYARQNLGGAGYTAFDIGVMAKFMIAGNS
jgi:outer membrane protease